MYVAQMEKLVFVLQTFLAPMSQVFPAEDDVNKHVDDNCKFAVPASFSLRFQT